MTVAEAQYLIGQRASVCLHGLSVDVRIVDVKQAYGATRYQVAPITGGGVSWFDSNSVQENIEHD